MNDETKIKDVVKQKYGQIAIQSSCGCGCGSSDLSGYTIMKDEYSGLNGYNIDADLGLGCGLPTEFAGIKKGDVVVDLGSGAGNDLFVALPQVGPEGRLIGIDFTEEMVSKANRNKLKTGIQNIEFKLGEIENIPLEENTADVVISNCVLNLVPDKHKAFSEVFRILKPGGHFCVSDIVIKGELPEGIKKSAEMYAGCVAGALQQDEYIKVIEMNNFKNIKIEKTKSIHLPDDLLLEYLSEDELGLFRENKTGIFSITVVGYK